MVLYDSLYYHHNAISNLTYTAGTKHCIANIRCIRQFSRSLVAVINNLFEFFEFFLQMLASHRIWTYRASVHASSMSWSLRWRMSILMIPKWPALRRWSSLILVGFYSAFKKKVISNQIYLPFQMPKAWMSRNASKCYAIKFSTIWRITFPIVSMSRVAVLAKSCSYCRCCSP